MDTFERVTANFTLRFINREDVGGLFIYTVDGIFENRKDALDCVIDILVNYRYTEVENKRQLRNHGTFMPFRYEFCNIVYCDTDDAVTVIP